MSGTKGPQYPPALRQTGERGAVARNGVASQSERGKEVPAIGAARRIEETSTTSEE
jgi:hypothetical protein